MTAQLFDQGAGSTCLPLARDMPSPVENDRIRALARRALEGAPTLSSGETRELAKAVVDHNEAFAAYPL